MTLSHLFLSQFDKRLAPLLLNERLALFGWGGSYLFLRFPNRIGSNRLIFFLVSLFSRWSGSYPWRKAKGWPAAWPPVRCLPGPAVRGGEKATVLRPRSRDKTPLPGGGLPLGVPLPREREGEAG